MLNPGSFRENHGYVTGSTGNQTATIEGEGELTLMGRNIGVFVSSTMNCNVISQGALCRTYSFKVVQDGDTITIVDKLSPQHRNVATWKFRGDNMAPIPDVLLR